MRISHRADFYTRFAYYSKESDPLMGNPPRFGDFRPMPREVNEISDRLRLIREAKGLNQATFARLVGIEPQAINNYETGLRRISVDQAIKICAATGVSLDYIYRGLTGHLPVDIATELQRLHRQDRSRRG
ncbi:MAG: helix-turn-helix transcriptional regulator [Bradyrhizobium sp.]